MSKRNKQTQYEILNNLDCANNDIKNFIFLALRLVVDDLQSICLRSQLNKATANDLLQVCNCLSLLFDIMRQKNQAVSKMLNDLFSMGCEK